MKRHVGADIGCKWNLYAPQAEALMSVAQLNLVRRAARDKGGAQMPEIEGPS